MKEGKCGRNVISHFVVPRSILLSLFTGMRYNRIQKVNSKTRVRPNLVLDPGQGWIHRATYKMTLNLLNALRLFRVGRSQC